MAREELRPLPRDPYLAMARRALVRWIKRGRLNPRYNCRMVLLCVNNDSGVRALRGKPIQTEQRKEEPRGGTKPAGDDSVTP